MAELTVAVLGLDRLGVSIALRLRSYMEKGGQHHFQLMGYDSREDYEKPTRKRKVFDKIERRAYTAVESADLVIMNLPFEDLRAAYELVDAFPTRWRRDPRHGGDQAALNALGKRAFKRRPAYDRLHANRKCRLYA